MVFRTGKLFHRLCFQGEPGLIQITATAGGGGIRDQHQTAGGDRIDPAARPDASVVFDAVIFIEVEIAQRRRPEEHHVFATGKNATAVRTFEVERLGLARFQIPGTTLGIHGFSVNQGP